MFKKIGPDNFISTPYNISETLHRVIQLLWTRKIDGLFFKLLIFS